MTAVSFHSRYLHLIQRFYPHIGKDSVQQGFIILHSGEGKEVWVGEVSCIIPSQAIVVRVCMGYCGTHYNGWRYINK